MDLLAFISGACVALVAIFLITKYRAGAPERRSLTDELNRIQARLTALAEPQPAPTGIFREKRADLIAALYSRLVALQRNLQEAHVLQTSEGRLYLGGREASERDVEQKLEREKGAVIEKAQNLGEFVAANRIYFDSTILEGLDTLLTLLQRMMSDSLVAGWLRRGNGAPLADILTEVTICMGRIEGAFKTLIGIADVRVLSDKSR